LLISAGLRTRGIPLVALFPRTCPAAIAAIFKAATWSLFGAGSGLVVVGVVGGVAGSGTAAVVGGVDGVVLLFSGGVLVEGSGGVVGWFAVGVVAIFLSNKLFP